MIRSCNALIAIGCLSVFALACAAPAPPVARNEVQTAVRSQGGPNRQLDPDYMPALEPLELRNGRIYYTRVNLWIESGGHSTTNYKRGTLLPVNSRVKLRLLSADGRAPTLDSTARIVMALVDDYRSISLNNVKSHSKVSMRKIVYRTFSEEPTDLSVLDAPTRKAIAEGVLIPGMTRYQVILARGYPPGHRTPALAADTWHYWSSRYRSSAIHFSDGFLSDPN